MLCSVHVLRVFLYIFYMKNQKELKGRFLKKRAVLVNVPFWKAPFCEPTKNGNLIRIKTGLGTYLIRVQSRTPPVMVPPPKSLFRYFFV